MKDKHSESLAGQAYLMLERDIVTLRLAPGQLLTEAFLIDRFGMGRTPVREAVQRLAWEGLMEIRPRAGVAVAALDPSDFAKVLEARRGVELVLAKSAARYASSADDEAFRFLTDEAFQNEGEAKLKVTRSKLGSCQLSTYFVGFEEHLEAKTIAVPAH